MREGIGAFVFHATVLYLIFQNIGLSILAALVVGAINVFVERGRT